MNNKVLIIGVLAVVVVVAGYLFLGADEPVAPTTPDTTTSQPAPSQ